MSSVVYRTCPYRKASFPEPEEMTQAAAAALTGRRNDADKKIMLQMWIGLDALLLS